MADPYRWGDAPPPGALRITRRRLFRGSKLLPEGMRSTTRDRLAACRAVRAPSAIPAVPPMPDFRYPTRATARYVVEGFMAAAEHAAAKRAPWWWPFKPRARQADFGEWAAEVRALRAEAKELRNASAARSSRSLEIFSGWEEAGPTVPEKHEGQAKEGASECAPRARPDAAMQFRPISTRLGRAMREGAGVDAQNVVSCSFEAAGPGEVYLNLRLFLDGEAAAKVMKALAAVDLNSEEWR